MVLLQDQVCYVCGDPVRNENLNHRIPVMIIQEQHTNSSQNQLRRPELRDHKS